MSTPLEFKRALDLISSGRVNLKPLITKHVPLREGLKGFSEAQKMENLRVMFRP